MLKNTQRFFFVIALICFSSSYTMATQAIILDNEEGPQDNGSSFIINSNRFLDGGIVKEVEVQKEGRYFLISPAGFFPGDCLYTAWCESNTSWCFTSGGGESSYLETLMIDDFKRDDYVPSSMMSLSIKEIFKN